MSYQEQVKNIISETAVITAASSGAVPVIIKGASGQTANLLTFQNNSGTTQGAFTDNGQLLAHGNGNITGNNAMGVDALNSITGSGNTAIGFNAMMSATGAVSCIAIGTGTLKSQAANSGIAIGVNALTSSTSSNDNIAIGFQALNKKTAGANTIGIGSNSFLNATTSLVDSIAIGTHGFRESTGSQNTGIGDSVARSLTSGNGNVFLGASSGYNSGANGAYANNTFIGETTGSNITTGADGNILIGQGVDLPVAGGDNQLSIGDIIFGTGINATTGLIGIHQATPTAFLDLPASSTASASLRIRTGSAPTSPDDGDVWQDGSNLLVRINGSSYTLDKTVV